MKTTRLSTKGQVVIPEQMREGLEAGTAFVVTRQKNMIILRKIEGLTKEELEEIEVLDKVWKDIESGTGITSSKEQFLKEMESW